MKATEVTRRRSPGGVILTTIDDAREASTPANPMDLYERALSVPTERCGLWVRDEQGRRFAVPVADWTASRRPGDESLLGRCVGATLDVGCGPGRLVAALTRSGVPALGVDVSPGAVAHARAGGAAAVCRSVFDPLPGDGQWDHAILADGNVGIGGDPIALLGRVRSLLAADGTVFLEVGGPGSRTHRLTLRLSDASGRVSGRFPWAGVGLDGLAPIAAKAGLAVVDRWTAAGRWFAALQRTRGWSAKETR